MLAQGIRFCLPYGFLLAITAHACLPGKDMHAGNALPSYVRQAEQQPLHYEKRTDETDRDIRRLGYTLQSQAWQHHVAIHIPQHPYHGQALLYIGNGDNQPHMQRGTSPSRQTLDQLARQTRSIVIAVFQTPNQPLRYNGDTEARKEDDLIAHDWRRFTENPAHSAPPLQFRMTAGISRAMTLAQQELADWDIQRFIVTGTSKRGWTAWLSSIADERVAAIAPAAMDVIGLESAMTHIHRSYGGNWPLAFAPYYQQSIDTLRQIGHFHALARLIDPASYLDSGYRHRLAIPAYIISASGDDFYVPDLPRYYMPLLPGSKTLRMLPNSDHAGTGKGLEQALPAFVLRLQQQRPLPTIHASLTDTPGQATTLTVHMSEPPQSLRLWHARNPATRDFRKACGIHYQQTILPAKKALSVSLRTTAQGWGAYFIEATFRDGFVATTPLYILPEHLFIATDAMQSSAGCKTLPGR